MRVKDLKIILSGLPDSMEVVVPSNDHTYNRCSTTTAKLFYDWPKYYDPNEDDYLTEVLVIE